MRVGAIDVGSNSVRLLVADVLVGLERDVRIDAIARAGEPCRLARGLERSGVIEEDMARRCADVVGEFARRSRALGAQTLLLAATAALRRAANSAEVATRIEASGGIPLRILSGDEEAQLVYQAVVDGLGPIARRSPCVVFDIGGGSTEVVSGLGDLPGRWTSLPIGAVSLTERFLADDPPAPAEIEALRAHVRDVLMQRCAYMPHRTPVFAGVGGTVTLLAALDRGDNAYDPALIEGHRIPGERLAEAVARLTTSDHDTRRRLPVMGDGRADIVVAGALVVDELFARFPSVALVCSTRGLRYALVRLAALEKLDGRPAGGAPTAP